MWEEIWEAVLESLIALPVLLLVYLLIEYLEHKKEVKFENLVAKSKKTGFYRLVISADLQKCKIYEKFMKKMKDKFPIRCYNTIEVIRV